MFELVCVLAIVLFCAIQHEEQKVLAVFLILLPFHTFLKSCFAWFFEGGEIFSAWKEVVILILAYKVLSKPHSTINGFILALQLIFAVLIIFYFFMADDYAGAMPALRDHLFPVVLFFTMAAMKPDPLFIRKMIMILVVSVVISDLAGFAQYFFFRIPVARIMDTAAYIEPSGYIHYRISSYRIMGFERMAGITGSPNIFGLFNAFAIILLSGVLLFKRAFPLEKNHLLLIRIALILSLVSILFSFSRAGWAIAIFGTGVLLFYRDFNIRLKYFLGSVLFVLVLVMVVSVLYPAAFDIISNSLSGKEASAAARTDSVMKGIRMLLDEPWGHGLGSTDNRREDVDFFVESAWMNIGYEIGLFGVFYLIAIQLAILHDLLQYARSRPLSGIAVAVAFSTLVACLVSVNPYGMPYIYLWWFLLGLGSQPVYQSFRLSKI